MDPQGLRAIPLFATLSDHDLELVGQFVSEVSVSAGKHLVDEGDYAYEFFMIEDGTAEVTRAGEKVAELQAGDFFGEVGLLEKQRRNASVVARTPMRLITLSHWDVTRLRKRWPEVYERLREATEARK
jgi:CRP/FNR family transcriptional regulator, cyclic AMP receptor protein